MSTSAVRVRPGPAITPLLTDRDSALRGPATRDLELPSVIAQRVAAAERDGYDRGYLEGGLAGEAEARQHAGAMLGRLTATIAEISALRTGLLAQTEQDIVRLAVAIAERIVRREVQINPQLLVSVARSAARQLGDKAVATIRLQPDDLATVVAQRESSPESGPIRLAADLSLPPGGCIVESALGSIDASLDAQIREVLRELLGDEAAATNAADPLNRDE
jgi:flagellar assembly protein FliH